MSVVRNPVRSDAGLIREHWTADSEQELQNLYQQVQGAYPTLGYGTMLYQVKPDPTGLLWHAEFSRFASCD